MQWTQVETQESLSEHQESVRITEHWHRLPWQLVETPPLEVLKSHLDTIVINWL